MADQTLTSIRLGTSSDRVFISYSRHDITLVESLVREMDKRGLPVWVDFRNLVPGTSYETQLETAIETSQAVLLVVTPQSIESPEVALERHFALVKSKRVILLVWVACPLDRTLQTLEWVDLRQPWSRAIKDLERVLGNPPSQPATRAPLVNRRRPPAVTLFYLMSLYVAPWSLFALVLPFFPWFFLRFPGRIARRDYNFRTATWMLLFVGFLAYFFGVLTLGSTSASMSLLDATPNLPFLVRQVVFAVYYFFIYGAQLAWILSWLMLLLLRFSPDLYRWAGPGGARIAPRKWRPAVMPVVRPVSVALDYAPQDAAIAKRLADELVKGGHTLDDDPRSADVTLALLSRFKIDTQLDPESVRLYPTLIQTPPDGRVADHLARIQWLDLRPGPRLYPALARLLGEPSVLNTAFGTLPARDLSVARPRPVSNLINLFWLVAGFKFALTFMFAEIYANDLAAGRTTPPVRPIEAVVPLGLFAIGTATGLLLTFLATRSLANRGGLFKSLLGPLVAFVLVAVTVFPGYMAHTWINFALTGESDAVILALISPCVAGVLAIPVAVVAALNRNLRLWMPLTGRLPRS